MSDLDLKLKPSKQTLSKRLADAITRAVRERTAVEAEAIRLLDRLREAHFVMGEEDEWLTPRQIADNDIIDHIQGSVVDE